MHLCCVAAFHAPFNTLISCLYRSMNTNPSCPLARFPRLILLDFSKKAACCRRHPPATTKGRRLGGTRVFWKRGNRKWRWLPAWPRCSLWCELTTRAFCDKKLLALVTGFTQWKLEPSFGWMCNHHPIPPGGEKRNLIWQGGNEAVQPLS